MVNRVTFTGAVNSLNGFVSGEATSPISVTSAGKVSQSYVNSSATDGDTRANYTKLTFTAAGSGEAARFYTTVSTTAVGAAPGGTINGAHISCDVDGSGTVSGAANALRATFGGTSTNPGGTLSVIQVDTNFATGGTWTNLSFLRFTNSGTGSVANLAMLPSTAANGSIFAAHTTQTMSHSIRIVDSAGTPYYIMCTNSASNRS